MKNIEALQGKEFVLVVEWVVDTNYLLEEGRRLS